MALPVVKAAVAPVTALTPPTTRLPPTTSQAHVSSQQSATSVRHTLKDNVPSHGVVDLRWRHLVCNLDGHIRKQGVRTCPVRASQGCAYLLPRRLCWCGCGLTNPGLSGSLVAWLTEEEGVPRKAALVIKGVRRPVQATGLAPARSVCSDSMPCSNNKPVRQNVPLGPPPGIPFRPGEPQARRLLLQAPAVRAIRRTSACPRVDST